MADVEMGAMVPRARAVSTTVPIEVLLPRSGYIENVGDYAVYISDVGDSFTAGLADNARVLKLSAGSILNFEGMDPSHSYYVLAETGASWINIVGVV